MSLGAAWYLEQVRAEYEMFVAGTLTRQIVADPMGDGEFVLCGEMQEGLRGHAAACFVGADGAVTPLGVGEAERVSEVVAPVTRRWREGPRPPTPRVRLGGRCHSFRRALGRYLLGVAEAGLGDRALVLGALGESVGVIVLGGDAPPQVLFVGEPGTIGVVDADRLLESWREGHAPEPSKKRRARAAGAAGMTSGRGVRRPPSAIQFEHRRVCGLPVEVAGGPPIAEVLGRIFAGLVARAEEKPRGLTPEQARSWHCCRGRRWIAPVCDALRRYSLLGLGDLRGMVGEVHGSIKEVLPDFSVPVDALGLVLRRLWVLGCGLVEKTETGRIWTIRVGAVADPRSRVHRRMCGETATRVALDGAADVGGGPLPVRGARRGKKVEMERGERQERAADVSVADDAARGVGARREQAGDVVGDSAGEEMVGGERAPEDGVGDGGERARGEEVRDRGGAGEAVRGDGLDAAGARCGEGAASREVSEAGAAAGVDRVGGGVRRMAELVPAMPEVGPLLVVTVLLLSVIAWWEQVDPEVHQQALLAARPWLVAVVGVVEGVAS